MGGSFGKGNAPILVGLMMTFGVILGWFVLYLMIFKPAIQVWLETQILEVGKSSLRLIKRSPFYHTIKDFPYDDLQGIAFKHPKKGDVSSKYPTLLTGSGNKLFF